MRRPMTGSAKQSSLSAQQVKSWIASSQALLAMTIQFDSMQP